MWCPAEFCRRPVKQKSGMVGPASTFNECYNPATGGTVDEVWTGSLIPDVAAPEGWTVAKDCAADDETPDSSMTNTTTDESGMGDMGSMLVDSLGACVDTETMDVDMPCIQGVLSTLDPAITMKLSQCAGGGSIADMQTCVEEQLSGGSGGGGSGDMTEPPGNDTVSPVAEPTDPPSSATSASAATCAIGAIFGAAAFLFNYYTVL